MNYFIYLFQLQILFNHETSNRSKDLLPAHRINIWREHSSRNLPAKARKLKTAHCRRLMVNHLFGSPLGTQIIIKFIIKGYDDAEFVCACFNSSNGDAQQGTRLFVKLLVLDFRHHRCYHSWSSSSNAACRLGDFNSQRFSSKTSIR